MEPFLREYLPDQESSIQSKNDFDIERPHWTVIGSIVGLWMCLAFHGCPPTGCARSSPLLPPSPTERTNPATSDPSRLSWKNRPTKDRSPVAMSFILRYREGKCSP